MTVFLFKAKQGEPDFGTDYNVRRFRQYLKDNEGKIFRISKEITTRSMSQNRLYWLYLGVVAFETGHTAEELHEFFKRTLLEPVFMNVLGKEFKVPRSTQSLNKVEFGEYLDKIAAETSVPIPDTYQYMIDNDIIPPERTVITKKYDRN